MISTEETTAQDEGCIEVFIILLRFDPDEPDERMPSEEEFSTFEDLVQIVQPKCNMKIVILGLLY
jgi:hypothetical protein